MIPGMRFENTLGGLVDPELFTDPIDTSGITAARGQALLRNTLLIRYAEETIADLASSGEAKCPCHLGVGQEAVAVGVSEHLRTTDRVFSGHRGHAHYLALGGDLDRLIAEVLGRETGASRGMGGSMHLYGPDVGFHGSVPIVAGTIPIALGAALAAKMDGSDAVAVSYFGDGAAEEGIVHETLNLAATMQLPILFVCENNLFSSHLDLHLRQPQNRIARFAEAHDVRSLTVDGNDVAAVSGATHELISAARRDRSPGFLEAITYRHRGHVGPNEDIDVGVHRKLDVLNAWKRRDPIDRLKRGLMNSTKLTEDQLTAMDHDVRTACARAVERARNAPYPPAGNLMGLVYGNPGA